MPYAGRARKPCRGGEHVPSWLRIFFGRAGLRRSRLLGSHLEADGSPDSIRKDQLSQPCSRFRTDSQTASGDVGSPVPFEFRLRRYRPHGTDLFHTSQAAHGHWHHQSRFCVARIVRDPVDPILSLPGDCLAQLQPAGNSGGGDHPRGAGQTQADPSPPLRVLLDRLRTIALLDPRNPNRACRGKRRVGKDRLRRFTRPWQGIAARGHCCPPCAEDHQTCSLLSACVPACHGCSRARL